MPDITNPIKVLFIDDDFEDMQFFKEGLSAYEPSALFTWIKESNKLSDFFKDANRLLYNIIFLDVKMPLKNGIECLKEIRNIHELELVPVVMFSTFRFNHDIDDSYSNGANLYAHKPSIFNNYVETFAKIFKTGWQKDLLVTSKNDYLLAIE